MSKYKKAKAKRETLKNTNPDFRPAFAYNTSKAKINGVNHPCYIFQENNNDYVYIQLTTKPLWKWRVNRKTKKKYKKFFTIRLFRNPNPKSSEPSYLVKGAKRDSRENFDSPKKNWTFSRNDKRIVKREKKKYYSK